jgi:hypothetical protein
MQKNLDPNREHLTTSQAAQKSGLSNIYLTRLLREGKLEGFQLAREWVIYTDSLEKFLATPRKSGPKGPRKKRNAKSQENTSNQSTSSSL